MKSLMKLMTLKLFVRSDWLNSKKSKKIAWNGCTKVMERCAYAQYISTLHILCLFSNLDKRSRRRKGLLQWNAWCRALHRPLSPTVIQVQRLAWSTSIKVGWTSYRDEICTNQRWEESISLHSSWCYVCYSLIYSDF